MSRHTPGCKRFCHQPGEHAKTAQYMDMEGMWCTVCNKWMNNYPDRNSCRQTWV